MVRKVGARLLRGVLAEDVGETQLLDRVENFADAARVAMSSLLSEVCPLWLYREGTDRAAIEWPWGLHLQGHDRCAGFAGFFQSGMGHSANPLQRRGQAFCPGEGGGAVRV